MTDLPHKILHIDDDFILRELMRAVFRGIDGFELRTAENGNQAQEIMQSFVPDLILLDLSMPGMDGPEFLRQLNAGQATNGTPVIFITQFDNVVMQGNFERLGVIGILHKPLHADTLLRDIRDLWVKRPVAA